jgi:hypothetical protein
MLFSGSMSRKELGAGGGSGTRRLLRELADARVEADDVRVISPFRAVIRAAGA